ncbi:hypothetical protein [Streptomyces doebereineriae]|uniref:Signal transduction histidine kinase subgroup 3 dimerisation and phosphoacceptor domain-containing protein n=1 Tax=Streptomyces doebereineriae TaxID=3075528 RepID=A0ABU2V3A3_9ACTN|nr:hypothetical protein [Streptomyces sp. DSM 41640]MDT0479442.1 hypothetical protein [Streptomyces sp. DSM 41640]
MGFVVMDISRRSSASNARYTALNEQANRQRQHQAQELHRALSTTATPALAYWLIHQPLAADQNTIEALSRLSREITTYASRPVWVQVAHLIQTFVQDLDSTASPRLRS